MILSPLLIKLGVEPIFKNLVEAFCKSIIAKSNVEKISSVVLSDRTEFTDLIATFSSIPDWNIFCRS